MSSRRQQSTLHSMSVTPTAGVHEPLEALLDLAESGLRTVATDVQFAIHHGWFLTCVDSIRGALLLEDAGLGRSADPLIRSALEHAVGMVWLHKLGWDAVEAVGRSHQRWAKNVRRAVEAADSLERGDGREDWSQDLQSALDAIADQEVPEGAVVGEWKIDKRFTVTHSYDLYVAWLSPDPPIRWGCRRVVTHECPYVVEESGFSTA